jgi:aminoglycoside phosphotransferase (APT) family kinase protein
VVDREGDQARRRETGCVRAAFVSAVDDFSGTTAVREAHRFDPSGLEAWLGAHVPGYAGPLTLEQFKGGQSNPTYKLSTPRATYVLRRKPPGTLLKGAHAVEREARILSALESVHFPVPHVYGLCTDESVVGTWFYVMDCVAGRIVWDARFPDVSGTDRARYFDAMNETLATLHGIDYAAIGLGDFGRTGNYFDRQIARWSTQYVADEAAGRDPNMDRLVEWLPQHIPPGDETRLIHGDFRVDNLVFHPTEPRIIGVLDWELSTLGNPLADFAYHLMMYRMPPMVITGLLGADLAALNIPSEADYVAAYCRRTGRTHIDHLDFYVAFNLFRLAAIFHGIKGRVVRGTAASAHAMKMVDALPGLAARAWQEAERAGRA